MATTTCIQDRTSEFRSILHQAQRRQTQGKLGSQRQSLLTASEKQNASATPTRKQRSEFARRAAEVGRGIGATMSKLERLAQLAKRKTLFDDRPEEINQLTFVIKQDLAQLNSQISQLESINKQQHPAIANPRQGGGAGPNDDQEGFHNKNVLTLLQSKLGAVGLDFKDVLEVRTKNIQASQDRQRNFVSSVSQAANPASLDTSRTDSPLYQTPQRGRSPKPGYTNTSAAQQDLLSIEPTGSSALARAGPQSDQQMLMMEEGGNQAYIQGRGEAIESIERTISELGGIFGQLAQMVSEQTEMIQRIDANTEDVVDNVQGAQRELMKYWNRVSGNRWLVAKMFGVLMIFFLLWVLIAG